MVQVSASGPAISAWNSQADFNRRDLFRGVYLGAPSFCISTKGFAMASNGETQCFVISETGHSPVFEMGGRGGINLLEP